MEQQEKQLEKKGIKEMSEMLEGIMELSLCMVDVMKDGVQAADFITLLDKFRKDEVLMAKMKEAYDKMGEIPEEIKDLDAIEISQLIMIPVTYVPKIVSLFVSKK